MCSTQPLGTPVFLQYPRIARLFAIQRKLPEAMLVPQPASNLQQWQSRTCVQTFSEGLVLLLRHLQSCKVEGEVHSQRTELLLWPTIRTWTRSFRRDVPSSDKRLHLLQATKNSGLRTAQDLQGHALLRYRPNSHRPMSAKMPPLPQEFTKNHEFDNKLQVFIIGTHLTSRERLRRGAGAVRFAAMDLARRSFSPCSEDRTTFLGLRSKTQLTVLCSPHSLLMSGILEGSGLLWSALSSES